jgi:hypothetical protein
MKEVKFPGEMKYIGGEISSTAVGNNNNTYADPNRSFVKFDITRDKFPAADVWFCRDCMFHLSFKDIFKSLHNFVNSSIPWAFLTTHINAGGLVNSDIETGAYRGLDLYAAPFDFPRDIAFWIADYIFPHAKREMCLWSREQIASALPSMPAKMLLF